MWSNPQETVDLVTFTEEILNGELHLLWSVIVGCTIPNKLRFKLYLLKHIL